MTPRNALILTMLAFATPLSAQTSTVPTITSGMEIQLRRAGDTTWTNATTGAILGSGHTCVMVKLEPVDRMDGSYILRTFNGFVAVRFKDAHEQWHELAPAELRTLQECKPS